MDERKKKEIIFKGGYSESAWKSLVIKSLRVGWANGIIEARQHLNRSTVKTLLVGGLFEDVFPAGWDELNECLEEINREDYEILCRHETHHGRGYTERFCDMADEAVEKGGMFFTRMMAMVAQHSNLKWLNPRIANCLYTWITIKPEDKGKIRGIDFTEWTGMPRCILDGHTYEGRILKTTVLLLSGHYENHRVIGQRVMIEGWDGIREEMFKKIIVQGEAQQKSLF